MVGGKTEAGNLAEEPAKAPQERIGLWPTRQCMTKLPSVENRIRDLLPVPMLCAFYLLFSTAFIVFFKLHTHYRLMIIPLHIGLVSAWLAGSCLLTGALINLRTFRTSRLAPYIVAFVFAIPWTFLIALYVIDYGANMFWGANVTVKILMSYVHELHNLFHALPFPSYWVYVPTAFLLAFILAVHIALAKPLLRSFEALFLPGRRFSLCANPRRTAAFLMAAFLLTSCCAGFLWRSLNWRGQFWHGEPIVALFKPKPMLPDTPYRTAILREAQQIRAQYPHDLSFQKKNVIIMMADSLRAGHMQVYGYERPTTPFLTSLAESGRLRKVSLMMSTCSETACGILSTLSSRQYGDLAYYNFKIYDLLQDCGYLTYFIAADDHTDFHGDRDILGRQWNLFFDGKSAQHHSMNDDELLLEGLEHVPAYSGTPAFFFFFLFSVHQVGVKHDEYERFQPARLEGSNPSSMLAGNPDREVLTNHYDNGIVQYDAYVERLFAALREKGYLDNSIVLLLADHGEGLGEHNHYSHCYYLNEEDTHIPLLIYDDPSVVYPNLEFATQIDVAPTIIDRLGLPIPSCWEGRSLLDPNIKSYSFHSTTSSRPSRAVVYRTDTALYKFIREDEDKHPQIVEELYELHSDPGERVNLIDTADPALVTQLRQQLKETFDTQTTR